jgi:membrane associated rhomboid family serine protease
VFPLRDDLRRRRAPVVNTLLILANSAIFLYQAMLPHHVLVERLLYVWAVVPERLTSFPRSEWVTVFTAMFFHGGWTHVLGNMIYLRIFGDDVEDRLGHGLYLAFYLAMGAVAMVFQVALDPSSPVPMIGASGAIAGALGAYLVFFPRARIFSVVPFGFVFKVLPVPAYYFLGLWFVLQVFQGVGSITGGAVQGDMGGVAWWAHSGGFFAGMVVALLARFGTSTEEAG